MTKPTHDLAAIAAELRAALNVLPKIDHTQGDLIGQRARFAEASQRLADHLREKHGAKITDKWDAAHMRLAGITSSSTSGLHGAMHNWMTAAKKRMAKENQDA